MKTMMLAAIVTITTAMGCAAEESSPPSAPFSEPVAQQSTPVSLGVAFYGLTIMDCQSEATACFHENTRNTRAFDCTAQLTDCLADISAQAAADIASETTETLQCGTEGLHCVTSSRRLSDILACQRNVNTCVVDRVHDLTGIVLPIAEDLVGATISTADHVLDTTKEVTETAVSVAIDLTTGTLDAAGKLVAGTLDATGAVVEAGVHVVGEVASAAPKVVQASVDVAGAVIGGVLHLPECSLQSARCWRETRDLHECQHAYAACLSGK